MSAIPAPIAGARHSRKVLPVALALGRTEAAKLLVHPASIIGALLGMSLAVVATWHQVPVLNRYDALTHEALIPFGCGVLVAANFGTMRARRHRTTELFNSLVATDAMITAAQLVAVISAAAFALLLVAAQLAFFKIIGGVTSPRPVVLLLGPALVAFGGGCGVALGRWAPRLFAGPLGLAAIVAVCIALTTNSYAHNREWLSLWVPSEVWTQTAGEVSLRPYGWRVLYIGGLAAIVATLAFGKHRRQRPVAIAVAAVLVVGTGYAGAQQLELPSRSEQIAAANEVVNALRARSCREFESIEYCAVKGYEPWIDHWRAPIEGLMAAVPAGARVDGIRVVQTPGQGELFDEDRNRVLVRRLHRAARSGRLSAGADISPPLNWGRNSAEENQQFAFALWAAAEVVGMETKFRVTEGDLTKSPALRRGGYKAGDIVHSCLALEQGRSIVAMWLAAQATDGAAASLERAVSSNPFVVEFDPSGDRYFSPEQWAFMDHWWQLGIEPEVTWGTRESSYAAQLLKRDEAVVRAEIAANWERLIDPATTSDEAAALLGLQRLPSLEEAILNWKYFKSYSGVERFGTAQCR